MKRRIMPHMHRALLPIFTLAAATAIAADGGSKTPPATIENAVKEGDLATVKLTPQAEQRLGIATAVVEKRVLPQLRTFAGEIVLPLATEGKHSLAQPVLGASPEEFRRVADLQADADGKLSEARAALGTVETAMKRAEQMFAEKAGSQRAVDEARGALDLAKATFAAAEARRGLLGVPVAEAAKGSRRWVRVTVFASELARLDPDAPGQVSALADKNSKPAEAKPVKAPASANAALGTMDVFYEIVGGETPEIGQRVAVSLPVRGATAESLVAPHAAVLHDFHGGAWVYEQTAPQTYVRRRVSVARVVGADAVLASGLRAGTKVVTSGAAELFGTEFGAGK